MKWLAWFTQAALYAIGIHFFGYWVVAVMVPLAILASTVDSPDFFDRWNDQ